MSSQLPFTNYLLPITYYPLSLPSRFAAFREIDRGGRENREEQKEKGVRRRPQRKIEEAVNQDAETARHRADRNAAPKMAVFRADLLKALFEEHKNKRRDA